MAKYKVLVKKEDLPAIPEDGKHLVRFRVVSVDENRTSYWIYKEVSGLGTNAPGENRSFQAEFDA